MVLLWIEEVATGITYVWQKNVAPSYTSRRTQSWLWENFYDHITPNIWPPNSPDWSSLDYYVYGTVERETNKAPCNTKDELKTRIMAAFTDLNKEIDRKACRRVWSRLEAGVEANGNKLYQYSKITSVNISEKKMSLLYLFLRNSDDNLPIARCKFNYYPQLFKLLSQSLCLCLLTSQNMIYSLILTAWQTD